MKGLQYIATRFGEPSTYAGIAGLLAAAHVTLDPGLWQHIVDAGMALSGLVAVIMKEAGNA